MDKNKDILSVSNSILLGSALIALSIFFSSGSPSSAAKTNTQNLNPGEVVIVEVDGRDDAPVMGRGEVVIEEFSDFQCPFCQGFWQNAYKEIKAKYVDTGKVKFIFRHFPLGFHVNAQKAAEAAECASRQGKFWEYHDVLFTKGQADGTGLDVPSLKSYANDLGLNTGTFNKCLDGGETADTVAADIAAGQKAGVTGTPTFIINGEKIVGAQPSASFEAVIEKALE